MCCSCFSTVKPCKIMLNHVKPHVPHVFPTCHTFSLNIFPTHIPYTYPHRPGAASGRSWWGVRRVTADVDAICHALVGWMEYTLWKANIAIENGHLQWIYPLKIVIFHSYVSLPEGKWNTNGIVMGLMIYLDLLKMMIFGFSQWEVHYFGNPWGKVYIFWRFRTGM